VELVLVSVEAWSEQVMVRLRGLPSETAERLEAEFEAALEAWGEKGAEGAPPQQPADWIFPDLSIGDNVGTRYALRSSARGGSNTMFRADYVFTPGPPETTETVEVYVDDAAPVQVRLAPTPSA
jgi:predicted phosphoadenosine phosphosulfate sulfurtransferase